jgi:methionine-rich copper-binding protein CopC
VRKGFIIGWVLIIFVLLFLKSGSVCWAAVTGGTSTANAPQITSALTEIAVSGGQVGKGGQNYFKFIPSTTGTYVITTSPTTVDTEATMDSTITHTYESDYNGGLQFYLTANLTVGHAYYLFVYGYNYSPASCTLSITGGGLQGIDHAPTISITNPTANLRYKDAQTVSISGSINDVDGDNVTVSATVNGKSVSTTVGGGSGTWTLTWDTTSIIEDTYKDILFTADDGLGATGTATYTGNIVVDKTLPRVNTLSPADNAGNVVSTANLVITFSENIAIGTGNITLKTSGGTTVKTIAVTDSTKVTGGGTDTITINPSTTLAGDYYVLIDATAFKDLAGNSYPGINGSTDWNFTTAGVSAPTVTGLSPADNAVNVGVNDNLVLNFSKNVVVGTGKITIKTLGGTLVESIAVTDAAIVSGSGTNIITINPVTTLAGETGYYVLIDAAAFKDTIGNSYDGITSSTDWNFTTIETTAPTVNSFIPANNATAAKMFDNLVINFSEVVRIGAGNITIKKTADDSAVETISVTDGSKVTGDGTSTITIAPATYLRSGTGYYVEIDSGAFRDIAGNKYIGISGSDGWNFTTADANAPWVFDFSPANNDKNVGVNANLIIQFSENVVAGTGYITIKKTLDDTTEEAIAAADTIKVTGGGSDRITINPAATLAENTGYYIVITPTAFHDPAGNNYAGISDKTVWNFTTADTTPPTVTIITTSPNPTNVSPIPVTITFSEAVTGFDVGDIMVSNGTKGTLSGTGTTYTLNITPSAQGEVKVNIAAGVAQDMAGNGNTAALQLSRIYDIQGPSVTISSSAANPTNVSPIPVTITFSEAVFDFTENDITVGNGATSNFKGNGTAYTVDITPSGSTVTLDAAAGVAHDAAGNGNTAASRLNLTYNGMTTMTITSSNYPVLTESGLDGGSITVTLTGTAFVTSRQPNFTLVNCPAGLTITGITNINSARNQCVINLAFNGSMTTDINNFHITVGGSEINNGGSGLTSNDLTIVDDLNPNKHYINPGGSDGGNESYLRNFLTAGNFRGDLTTTWNHAELILGKGISGIHSDLWFYYPGLTGDGGLIPTNTPIDRAELVFKVKSINGDKYTPRRIKIYTIPDSGPDRPFFGTADGLRSGLNFLYRDNRPGRKVPWKDGAKDISAAVTDTIELNDTCEYLPYAFEENGELLIKVDVTKALRAWAANPDKNQGWYIMSEGEGNTGDNLSLYGTTAANISDRPYLRVIYADNGTDLTPPAAVGINISSLKTQSQQITLNWTNPPSDVTGMRIVRKYGVTPSGPEDGIVIVDKSATAGAGESYIDNYGLVNGRTYYYAFFAYDSFRNYSPKSYIALNPEAWTSALAEPNSFNATAASTSVSLTWAIDASNKASNFEIMRSDDGGTNWNRVSLLPVSQTTYQDNGLQPNTSHQYRLRAVNPYTLDSQGNPANFSTWVFSNPNPVTTLNAPIAPANLFWSVISSSEVQLRWDEVAGQTYRIEILDETGALLRSEAATVDIQAADPKVFQYSVMRLTVNTGYRFRVVAINGAGENAAETEVIKTAADPKPIFF